MAATIALATCSAMPVEADESPLERALEAASRRFEWAVWDDPAVDWSRYAGVLIRTTWDYTDKVDAFRSWASAVAEQTALWNAAPLVRWNSHKRYLADLAAQGVDTVPTVLAPVGDGFDGARLPADGGAGWIVKPAESVGSIGLSRWPPGADGGAGAVEAALALHRAGQDALVQPLMPGITAAGEVSIVVVDGAVSHAVRKVPAPGDIRSQPEWGAGLTAVVPTAAQVALGRAAIAAATELAGVVPHDVLYARVDCVDHGGRPVLMELEVIEPDLYLGFDDDAAGRVVAAIERRVAA